MSAHVAVVVPVYCNGPTLAALVGRLDATLNGSWSLRLVVDACPEDSAAVAAGLAAVDPRVRVTVLAHNVGQHRAIATGLLAEPQADVWVCLDGDLQDPPEAVPALVDQLARQRGGVVFAGRRGSYEAPVRRLTGMAHRRVVRSLTGLPPGAGAFLAMDPRARDAVVRGVLEHGVPSVVVAAGAIGGPLTTVPVRRDVRAHGRSAWTTRARVRQSVSTIGWAARERLRRVGPRPS